jgi:hypothetical protein
MPTGNFLDRATISMRREPMQLGRLFERSAL